MRNQDLKHIGVAGDWHGDELWADWALQAFSQAGVKHILQAGDFGISQRRDCRYLTNVQKRLEAENQTIYVTPGNHEDYVFLASFIPSEVMPGFTYHPDFPNILVAERGARWRWNGVSFVSLGGAASIDYNMRQRGVNWWEEEAITVGDVYRVIRQGEADVMIAHEAPAGVFISGSHRENKEFWLKSAWDYTQQSRGLMRQAINTVKPNVFFHGHYHRFIETDITLSDDSGSEYTYHHVGLDKDGTNNNLGVFDLATRKIEMLELNTGRY